MSRVVFFETTNVSPHIETALELAKRHLDAGDAVELHFLGRGVPFNDFLVARELFIKGCRPERKGAALVASDRFRFVEPVFPVPPVESLPTFSSAEALKAFKYRDYHAGLSAYSSLIDLTRSASPPIERWQSTIREMIVSGIAIYDHVLNELVSRRPDVVYLFNGRFVVNRAILDACVAAGVPYLVHERGADKCKYSVRPFMPHDLSRLNAEVLETWNNAPQPAATEIAQGFYRDRRHGKEQGWLSFVTEQSPGLTRADFAKGRKLITYFSSTEDEYASVGDLVKWDRWPSQMAAVRDLVSLVARHPEWALILRLHPHLAGKAAADLQPWLDLELPPNAELVMPKDALDSYAQVEASDVVVTVGSTVGIESVFWGTPSICLGPGSYENLDAVYLPHSVHELESLLQSTELEASPDRALPYGYYAATFGEEFRHYRADSLFQGKFMGVDLQNFGRCSAVRRFGGAIATVRSAIRSVRRIGSPDGI